MTEHKCKSYDELLQVDAQEGDTATVYSPAQSGPQGGVKSFEQFVSAIDPTIELQPWQREFASRILDVKQDQFAVAFKPRRIGSRRFASLVSKYKDLLLSQYEAQRNTSSE